MYAVLTTGGKQYRVEAGSTLLVDRFDGEPGSTVVFDRVLLVGDGDSVMVGRPLVDGATVSATVLGEALADKIVVFKFKQKVKYRRRTGHRQHLTRVRVDAITAGGKTTRAEASTATTGPAQAAAVPATAEAAGARQVPSARRPSRRAKTAVQEEQVSTQPVEEAAGAAPVDEAPRRARRRTAKETPADASAAPTQPPARETPTPRRRARAAASPDEAPPTRRSARRSKEE